MAQLLMQRAHLQLASKEGSEGLHKVTAARNKQLAEAKVWLEKHVRQRLAKVNWLSCCMAQKPLTCCASGCTTQHHMPKIHQNMDGSIDKEIRQIKHSTPLLTSNKPCVVACRGGLSCL